MKRRNKQDIHHDQVMFASQDDKAAAEHTKVCFGYIVIWYLRGHCTPEAVNRYGSIHVCA